jgi:minor extracellular serine protease Vpr
MLVPEASHILLIGMLLGAVIMTPSVLEPAWTRIVVLTPDPERTAQAFEMAGFRIVEVLRRVLEGVVVEGPRTFVEASIGRLSSDRVFRDSVAYVALDRSRAWIHANDVSGPIAADGLNLTGEGAVVGIIDTGVDYTHPDLGGGFGPGHKVIGGFDFVDDDADPLDVDRSGHGTHVAGVVAADGILQGVAPKARLLAYRVVAPNGRVLASDIARALEHAVNEGAQVVNISLGTELVSPLLEVATRNAVRNGVMVVAAAGNAGPFPQTIGTPANQRLALTVGASLNNASTSLAAAFASTPPIRNIMVHPLNGSAEASDGVEGRIVFAGYGRVEDVSGLDLRGAIALVERGPRFETVFFSEKEANAAARGAVGLLIYNEGAGPFRGDLIHELNPPAYRPSLPTAALSREDGLRLRELLEAGPVNGVLRVYVDPDQVAFFSSRGPVSLFYVKPDLVAPGTQINSTDRGGSYSVLGGTSFSAPHVAGAAALLLQLYPDLTPEELASLLTVGAVPLRDAFGVPIALADEGAGRLDVLRASLAPVTALPHTVVAHLAADQRTASPSILLRALADNLTITPRVDCCFREGEESVAVAVDVVAPGSPLRLDQRAQLNLTISLREPLPGMYEGRLWLASAPTGPAYGLPLMVVVNPASLVVVPSSSGVAILPRFAGQNATANLEVTFPNGAQERFSVQRPGDIAAFTPTQSGEYWVEAEVGTPDGPAFAGMVLQLVGEGLDAPSAVQPLPSPGAGVISLRAVQLIVGFVGVLVVVFLLYAYAARRRGAKPAPFMT